jgi:hypothetical protein
MFCVLLRKQRFTAKIGVIHGISLLKLGHGCNGYNGFSRIKQIRVYLLNLCHLRAICP